MEKVAGLTMMTNHFPSFFVTIWVLVMVILALAAFVAVGIWLYLNTRNQPFASGAEALIGQVAEVRQRLAPQGQVFIEGALWQAVSEQGELGVGELVQIVAVHKLRLVVRRLESKTKPETTAS